MRISYDQVTPSNAPEILSALPDAIAMGLGRRVRAPHPFSECIESSPMKFAAFAAGKLMSSGISGESSASVISRGLRSFEFANALAVAIQDDAQSRFDAQARHRVFVSKFEVQKLGKAEPLGNLNVTSTVGSVKLPKLNINSPLNNVTQGAEFFHARGRVSDGESVTVFSFGRILDITRDQVINDDFKAIADAVGGMGITAARHEARLVAAALESNAALSDGGVVFHADYGNLLATAFGETALAAAIAALRNQPAPDGMESDVATAHLVVSASLEYSANKLVHDSGMPIAVSVLASLPAGRYYLIAAPEITRTVGVAQLEGASHPLAVEAVKAPLDRDGLSVRVRLDVGADMVGRLGILKGG